MYWGGLGFKETKYKSVASAQPTTNIIQLAPENQLQIGEFPWAKDFAFGRLKVFRKPIFSVLENRLAMIPQINISTMWSRAPAHVSPAVASLVLYPDPLGYMYVRIVKCCWCVLSKVCRLKICGSVLNQKSVNQSSAARGC